MIDYERYILSNGLEVLAHRDPYTSMVAVNLLYRVGSRNENPLRTGFAHLFEHLMFRGTRCIPNFDVPVQEACGENNAFTTNDYTDYYITLPKENVETAFWLESDRMTGLNISEAGLAAEKQVVIEEYNQRYLNQPYGDQWLLLREMAYRVHPYRWPTIGLTPDHIRDASLADVKGFYGRYYRPSNAILSVAGDLDPEAVFHLAEHWFGGLHSEARPVDVVPEEPEQQGARRKEVWRDVPATQITIAFVMGDRRSREYYLCDLITDLLAGGSSARLYRKLVRETGLFSAVNAYVTGDMDRGLFVVTGQLLPGVSVDRGEAALWNELECLKNEPVDKYEMEKVQNKFEAGILFGELNVMNKAMNLGYYALLGDMELLNGEVKLYRSIVPEEICETTRGLLTRDHASTLIIYGKDEK